MADVQNVGIGLCFHEGVVTMARMFWSWTVAGLMGLGGLVTPARAQIYPGGLGGWGWRGWGSGYASNPNATYMQGLGYYLKSQGQYKIDEQKAKSLEIDNIVKWNKALRQAQRIKRIEQGKEDAKNRVLADFDKRMQDIKTGQALNDLLDKIIEFPTPETHKMLASTPLSPEVLGAIAFENATEPLTLCLDELTKEEAWPQLLRGEQFSEARKQLASAVDAALQEDLAGPLTEKTRQSLVDALALFRKTLDEKVPFFNPDKNDAQQYLVRLTAMTKMLEDTDARPIVKLLETYKEGNLFDLVAFMHAFNLRFAAAADDRQFAIYKDLAERLGKIPTSYDDSKLADTSQIEAATRDLANASKKVFEGLEWGDLDQIGQKEQSK